MAGYTAIAETGSALVKILQEAVVPDLVPNENGVGLCSPLDKGDTALGVYLYDVRENEEIRVSGMLNTQLDRQQYPSVYLSLYYMITAYSNSDLKFRASEEQRLLGRALQALHDRNSIPVWELGAGSGISLRIELQNLQLEDKLKIWNMPEVPFRPSLFYKVSPVEVESTRTRKISRVTEASFEWREEGYV